VQLSQSETLAALDGHQRRVGHVDPDLDHAGRNQDLNRTLAKRLHDRFPLGGRDPAVDQAQPEVLQRATGQGFEQLLGTGHASGLRGFDQRRHDVALAALAQFPAKEFPPGLATRFVAQIRVQRGSTWRLGPQGRHVQVPEHGHGYRAGDRRGCHDQVVWIEFRTPQRRPLPHAEPVLFVDHHQSQAVERNLLAQQCMGADDQVDLPRCDRLFCLTALGGTQSTGQHRDPHPAGMQIASQRACVLACQHFGRRHQGGLESMRDGQQHGVFGDHRLATAHVAVQQAVHGSHPSQVGGDFGDRSILILGQREREQPPDAGIDLGRHGQRRRVATKGQRLTP
jgi:hypothetical protein